MNCNAQRDRFSAYLDGELPAPAAIEIDGHLDSCPDCRTELQSLRRTVDLVRSLRTDRIDVDFSKEIAAAIREVGPIGAGGGRVLRLPARFPIALAGFGALAAALLVLATAFAPQPNATPAGPTARTDDDRPDPGSTTPRPEPTAGRPADGILSQPGESGPGDRGDGMTARRRGSRISIVDFFNRSDEASQDPDSVVDATGAGRQEQLDREQRVKEGRDADAGPAGSDELALGEFERLKSNLEDIEFANKQRLATLDDRKADEEEQWKKESPGAGAGFLRRFGGRADEADESDRPTAPEPDPTPDPGQAESKDKESPTGATGQQGQFEADEGEASGDRGRANAPMGGGGGSGGGATTGGERGARNEHARAEGARPGLADGDGAPPAPGDQSNLPRRDGGEERLGEAERFDAPSPRGEDDAEEPEESQGRLGYRSGEKNQESRERLEEAVGDLSREMRRLEAEVHRKAAAVDEPDRPVAAGERTGTPDPPTLTLRIVSKDRSGDFERLFARLPDRFQLDARDPKRWTVTATLPVDEARTLVGFLEADFAGRLIAVASPEEAATRSTALAAKALSGKDSLDALVERGLIAPPAGPAPPAAPGGQVPEAEPKNAERARDLGVALVRVTVEIVPDEE